MTCSPCLNHFLPSTLSPVSLYVRISLQRRLNVSYNPSLFQPKKNSAQEALTWSNPLQILCIPGGNPYVTQRHLRGPKSSAGCCGDGLSCRQRTQSCFLLSSLFNILIEVQDLCPSFDQQPDPDHRINTLSLIRSIGAPTIVDGRRSCRSKPIFPRPSIDTHTDNSLTV